MSIYDDSEDWFGDLDRLDCHDTIERWERADEALALEGMSPEQRTAFWKSLDPDSAVQDWYDELVAGGLSDVAAREYIAYVGREFSS